MAAAMCPLALGSGHRKKGPGGAGPLSLQIWMFGGEAGCWPGPKLV